MIQYRMYFAQTFILPPILHAPKTYQTWKVFYAKQSNSEPDELLN